MLGRRRDGGVEGPDSSFDESIERHLVERLEAKQGAARPEWRVHLEVRVFGRGTDEGQGPVLDGRKQGVLLRPREPVDLVEEENGSAIVKATPFHGPVDDLADVSDTSGHRRQLFESPMRGAGDGEGEGGLTGARWAPEDGAREAIGFDQCAKWSARTDEVILPDDIVDRARAKTSRQWRPLA